MNIARQIVNNIQKDLNDRSGFDLRSLDEVTEAEITETWVAIVDRAHQELIKDVVLSTSVGKYEFAKILVKELKEHLNRLTGMKFSDRMHAALVSRAEKAEEEVYAAKVVIGRKDVYILELEAELERYKPKGGADWGDTIRLGELCGMLIVAKDKDEFCDVFDTELLTRHAGIENVDPKLLRDFRGLLWAIIKRMNDTTFDQTPRGPSSYE